MGMAHTCTRGIRALFDNAGFEKLSVEQADTVDDAARLVIGARKGAAAMLNTVGLDGDSMFGNPCTGHFDGSRCPCSDYSGPGNCRTRISPPGVPLQDSTARCSHPERLHLPS
jgi:hypothetical protein